MIRGEEKQKVLPFPIRSELSHPGIVRHVAHGRTRSGKSYLAMGVLFERLTGSPVFVGENIPAILAKILFGEVPAVRSLRPEVPPQLDAVIHLMLAKEPEERLGDGATVAVILSTLRCAGSVPRGRAAPVSLGQIALHQGKAAEALGYFDSYLTGAGGPLAAEGRVGRVQRLRWLGRAANERAAIADFLAPHGEGVHAPRLRARLSELGGG